MVTFFLEGLQDRTSFGMGTDLMEIRLVKKASGGMDLVLDVLRGTRPSVVILENVVDHGEKHWFENIQLLPIVASFPIAESLRMYRGQVGEL